MVGSDLLRDYLAARRRLGRRREGGGINRLSGGGDQTDRGFTKQQANACERQRYSKFCGKGVM